MGGITQDIRCNPVQHLLKSFFSSLLHNFLNDGKFSEYRLPITQYQGCHQKTKVGLIFSFKF